MRDDSSEGRFDEDMLFVTIFASYWQVLRYLGELTLLITHEHNDDRQWHVVIIYQLREIVSG